MKDLDFDELDRAVNSLMAGVPKQPVSADQPAEKTVTINNAPNASVSREGVGQGDNLQSGLTPGPGRSSVSPTNAPAARRGGRFMDVVHPSSDMNAKKPEAPVERPVSRQAATIEPASSVSDVPKKEETTTLPAAPLEVPSPPVTPKPAQSHETSPAAHGDWPDPLDMAGFGKASNSDTEKSEAKDEKPAEPAESKSAPEPPLISPFLADTKVDKRPLGGNATPDAVAIPPENKTQLVPSKDDENDDQLPATLEDTKPLLPEELHNDLMAIESDTTEPEPVQPTQEVPLSPSATTPPDDKKEEAKTEQPAPVPTGPVSIPQQYKEEPSSQEPKSGAIYDTDAYHQPLAHPAKQKSGWMWIVWIVLILILGAGVGAALYLLRIVQ